MGTLAATLAGDAAPPSRTELPESGSSEPAATAPFSASSLVGLGSALLTFPFPDDGGGTTRNSLGFLEMGGGFLLGEGLGAGWCGVLSSSPVPQLARTDSAAPSR